MSLELNEIFNMPRKNNSELNNIPTNNLKNYKKKGDIEENAMNELYQVTVKKLDNKYKDRLSLLLYNGNNVDNYFSKRANLDKIVYKYDKDKLYITLSNFNNKNKSSSVKNISNNSFQNFTENMSHFMTNDTNNINNNSEYLLKEKKQKISTRENYAKFKDDRYEREIDQLLLNENKQLPKHIEKYIFKKLSQKYNFMKEDKKIPMNNMKIYSSIKTKPNFKDNMELKYIDNIKEKTNELRALKNRNHKNYLSPIFFLSKTNDKYIQKISYDSHDKFKQENKAQIINNIKKDNLKYLNIMGKDVNNLQNINKENKDII